MNWKRVDELLRDCTKGSASGASQRSPDLGDYSEFLARHDGAEGFIGPDQYLILWKSGELAQLNAGYQVEKFAPGYLLIGGDGGTTAFGLQTATHRFVAMPFIGLAMEDVEELGDSFEEFLEKLATREG